MTRIESKLKKAGLMEGVKIINRNQIEIQVMDLEDDTETDYETTDKLKNLIVEFIEWGGYRTGYGSWILSKDYSVSRQYNIR